MKKIYLLLCFILSLFSSIAQYKNDNVLYKTVYPQDLCKELERHPGYMLLDVRSPGEYADTSSMGMNIGRFKNAINIDVRNLAKQLPEIYSDKNKPIFVYCSHSQRSRRASKMLADSGFTQVYNINTGMTGLRQLPVPGNECLYDKLMTNIRYNFISAIDLCTKISADANKIFLLDVRDDSAYNHISRDAEINSFGYFKNSTHVPLSALNDNLSKIPSGKEIIVIDLDGSDAAKAANLLIQKNYAKVSVLMEGIDAFTSINSKNLLCIQSAYITDLPYKVINAQELKGFVETSKDYLFVDARTTEEFTNSSKNYWQNTGHLVKAVNIPFKDLDSQWKSIETYKTKPVIVYVFSGNPMAYDAANILVKNGFTNVMVLQGGIFSIGWTAANVKGYSSLANLKTDVPAANQ